RPTTSADSNREEILPSNDENLTPREAEEPQQRPTTSADSNPEEISPSAEENLAPSPHSQREPLVEESIETAQEEILPTDDVNDEAEQNKKREKAATKIQSYYRGYRTRKDMMVRFLENEPEIIPRPPSSSEEVQEEKHPHEEALEQEALVPPVAVAERPGTPAPLKDKKMTYTISITTGNRWGAETEANLYIQLFGDEQTSRRFYLKQE
ncbi:unnamed protein product, partial [Strongylus vulgaris]